MFLTGKESAWSLWHGLEKYDLPVIMGVVLFIPVILILTNIFVDILYALLDPRVRLS